MIERQSQSFPARSLLGLLAIGLLSSCVAARVSSASHPDRKPVGSRIPIRASRVPSIRVLLKASFSEALVQGAREAANLRVTGVAGRIQVRNLDTGRLVGSGSGFRFEPGEFQHLRVDSRPYRGAVEVFVNPQGRPVIVNEVAVDEYLLGVLPHELILASSPLEAIKAQSVAARTFALANRGRQARLGFDVFSDSRSQVYGGTLSENPKALEAVRETQGHIAIYEGTPILAMYSSTCGGMTADYASTFLATALPYLRGGVRCRDQSSPYHLWETTVDVSKLESRLLGGSGALGPLQQIVPIEKGPNGRTLSLRLEGSEGSRVLRGIQLRRALGLRSNWILDLKVRRDDDGHIASVRIRGKGWGHGVGLCQYGAVEMASRGSHYREILEHYFPGSETAKAW